jgi:hypothetical protein
VTSRQQHTSVGHSVAFAVDKPLYRPLRMPSVTIYEALVALGAIAGAIACSIIRHQAFP